MQEQPILTNWHMTVLSCLAEGGQPEEIPEIRSISNTEVLNSLAQLSLVSESNKVTPFGGAVLRSWKVIAGLFDPSLN